MTASKTQREEPPPKKQREASHPPKYQIHDGEFVCDDCKAVDWSRLPSLATDGLLSGLETVTVRRLDATFGQLNSSPCKICRILSLIKPASPDGQQQHLLTALPASRALDYGPSFEGVREATLLGAFQEKDDEYRPGNHHRYLAVMGPSDDDYELGPRRILPGSIDYGMLKNLAQFCEDSPAHKNCRMASSPDNVFDLKVIDVWDLKVIEAPERCKYLALSYVWGQQTDDSSLNDLKTPPPVIRDAISVTKSLDHRYLWIDKYVSSNCMT